MLRELAAWLADEQNVRAITFALVPVLSAVSVAAGIESVREFRAARRADRFAARVARRAACAVTRIEPYPL